MMHLYAVKLTTKQYTGRLHHEASRTKASVAACKIRKRAHDVLFQVIIFEFSTWVGHTAMPAKYRAGLVGMDFFCCVIRVFRKLCWEAHLRSKSFHYDNQFFPHCWLFFNLEVFIKE